jgi:hypothetical protein
LFLVGERFLPSLAKFVAAARPLAVGWQLGAFFGKVGAVSRLIESMNEAPGKWQNMCASLRLYLVASLVRDLACGSVRWRAWLGIELSGAFAPRETAGANATRALPSSVGRSSVFRVF